MPVKLAKDSIDLGIIARDGPAMVTFYRDVLGFIEEPQTPFPGGGVMHRLRCGTSLIKVVVPKEAPKLSPAPGPIPAASGYRYWTMIVSNLEEIVATCQKAGRKLPVPITQVRPGVRIAIVEDPDGNLVEFVDMAA